MLNMIKNDWSRIKVQKMYLMVSLGLTVFSVILAIVLTSKLQPKVNLAVVKTAPEIAESSMLQVTYLNEQPPESELIQNRYDAVVSFSKDGTYQIQTIKGNDWKEKLSAVLDGKRVSISDSGDIRKIGTNIIGYMLMFLLMQGVLYARLFAEDKEKHLLERIAVSPIAFWRYLGGHMAFLWILITLPSFLVIVAADAAGVAIGFQLWQYVLILALLGLLSTAFAMFNNSFFCVSDTANMVGSCIIVLTSVLGGSFYEMGNDNSLFGRMIYLLPQKNLMHFVDGWEKQNVNQSDVLGLIYVIIGAAIFVAIAVQKTRRDYIYHRSR